MRRIICCLVMLVFSASQAKACIGDCYGFDLIYRQFRGCYTNETTLYKQSNFKSPIKFEELEDQLGFFQTMALFSYAAYGLSKHERCGNHINSEDEVANSTAYELASSYGVQFLEPKEFDKYFEDARDNVFSPRIVAENAPYDWKGLFHGIYANGNSAVLLARTRDVLIVAFRGTNDRDGDESIFDKASPDTADWFARNRHYSRFAEITPYLARYASDAESHISKVYVVGHSLGAAMAQMYMHRSLPRSIEAQGVTFASPGMNQPFSRVDPRVLNFWIDGDALNFASDWQKQLGYSFVVKGRLAGIPKSGNTGELIHDPKNYICLGNTMDAAAVTPSALRRLGTLRNAPDQSRVNVTLLANLNLTKTDMRSSVIRKCKFWAGESNIFRGTSDAEGVIAPYVYTRAGPALKPAVFYSAGANDFVFTSYDSAPFRVVGGRQHQLYLGGTVPFQNSVTIGQYSRETRIYFPGVSDGRIPKSRICYYNGSNDNCAGNRTVTMTGECRPLTEDTVDVTRCKSVQVILGFYGNQASIRSKNYDINMLDVPVYSFKR